MPLGFMQLHGQSSSNPGSTDPRAWGLKFNFILNDLFELVKINRSLASWIPKDHVFFQGLIEELILPEFPDIRHKVQTLGMEILSARA
jgi:hypothetical protein